MAIFDTRAYCKTVNLNRWTVNLNLQQRHKDKIKYGNYTTAKLNIRAYCKTINDIKYVHHIYLIIKAINLNLQTVGGIKISNLDELLDPKRL